MTLRFPLARTAATFAGGMAGGALFELAGVPLAWLLGALLVVAAAGLAGFATTVPAKSRQIGQVVVGVAVGLYFTPSVAAQVLTLAPAMVISAILSIAASILFSRQLARAAGIDGTTAYFASLPGGVAEMAVLAERHHGNTALVALAQSLRVVCVVVIIPPVLTLAGLGGAVDYAPGTDELRPFGLALMIGVALATAWMFSRLKVTNPWLLGGLLIGVALGVSGLQLSRVPNAVVDLGQLLIGCALGIRFRRDTLRHLRGFIPATVLGSLCLMGVSAVLAASLIPLTGLELATLVLATAPGGIAEMSITAKVLALGVPAVTAFQLVRIVTIVLLSEPLYRLVRPFLGDAPQDAGR